ncbi:MAG: thioredoxin family protein, partial [Duncaniella sp.]|nr:thioredoxin family protein [Duncaniella sp.]
MAQGIDFLPAGSTLAEAVAKAKAEGKLVFLDCYTSWCGPCKMMSSKIFPTQEVGDFMNPKFVSIKIDMEKGEGPSLVEKLQVSAYPTFIIFNGEGDEVGRFLGGSDAARFMENVTKNSVANASAEMQKRFDACEREHQFLN